MYTYNNNKTNSNKAQKLIQITSGRGPAECCWVVAQVLKYLVENLKTKGSQLTWSVLDREQGIENGTLVSATVQLEGNGQLLSQIATDWVGTIQWIGQSKFRKHHKRKNWYVGINELEIPPGMQDIKDSEIQYQSMRAGGPGGQHVNKVNTAVRATHIPTGINVMASDHKSQLQNKKAARERLAAKLKLQSVLKAQQMAQAGWQNHNELERGNPVKVFRGSDFKPRREKEKDKNKANRMKGKQDLKNQNYFDSD